ncbi:hypothetical protein DPMN_185210 [Dreissena polymorpha]|uniref:Uncharacterized protein n=1 Tax=Dreissena polymorpha TaxID=45954 RepID=A0A9D4DLR4_DREPO|nr:hypothetical protein DPMN_185206 [Dreissena polymorpha]KAH3750680.1 hypothetical protein DPMN_185210 [Dreissena polymorpha]
MGINWNARQDGTNRPRRLRGNSSAILVGYTRRLGGCTLVGYGSSTSQIALYIYFWEYTSRQIRT